MASKATKKAAKTRKPPSKVKPGKTKPRKTKPHKTKPGKPKRAALARAGLGRPSAWRATIAEMLQRLPTPEGKRSDTAFTHGTMEIKLYAPRGHDPQQPHDRDEVYVVMYGSGTFRNGGHHHPFRPGDLLFVPAEVEHRFEDFTDDLVVWVVFYGPRGGERPR